MVEDVKKVDESKPDVNQQNDGAPRDDDAVSQTDETSDVVGVRRKRRLPLIIIGIVLIVGAIGGLIYWLYARQYESTDDAFIEGNIVQVSPKISANVVKVNVTDNQVVKKGDLLVELDARDFEARLEQAKAQLAQARAQAQAAQANVNLTRRSTNAGVTQAASGVRAARANVAQAQAQAAARRTAISQASAGVQTARANLAQAQAQVDAAQAEANRAEADVRRYQELYAKDEISKQRLDQAVTTAQTAQAQLEAARRRVSAAESQVAEAQASARTAEESYRQSLAQIGGAQAQVGEAIGRLEDANAAPQRVNVSQAQVGTSEAQIAQAEAAVRQAELELSYTKIYAEESGRIARKNVEVGQLVQPGQALMAIVFGDVWVVANFKETQLDRIRVGQPVDVKVDAYSDVRFEGRVDSIQPGTGSRFSVLPPENATGNYVKVVQRVPVKITLNKQPDDNHLLAPGMSVEPKVKVR
jgi:membrane fusion protein (multidrug efflux system)